MDNPFFIIGLLYEVYYWFIIRGLICQPVRACKQSAKGQNVILYKQTVILAEKNFASAIVSVISYLNVS